MELTKEHFDEVLRTLATKKDLTKLATSDDLSILSEKMDSIETILDQHTTALDAIAKDVKDWDAEMTLMRNRMERYEAALQAVAGKLNLDINPLPH